MKKIVYGLAVVAAVVALSGCEELGAAVNNSEPVADAGDDFTAEVGDTITLDGSGSYDDDGDDLDYAWNGEDPGGDDISGDIEDRNDEEASYTVTTAGEYTFVLTVSDSFDEDSDTVKVTVTDGGGGSGGGDGGESGDLITPGVPVSGSVAYEESVYYYFPTTLYSTYSVDLTGLSADADIAVYGSSDETYNTEDIFIDESYSDGTIAESVDLDSEHFFDYFIVEVFGFESADYTLSVTETTWGSYATVLSATSPVSGFELITGTFAAWSFASAGATWDFALDNETGDLDLSVYESSDEFFNIIDTPLDYSLQEGTTDESITGITTSEPYLIVVVSAFEGGTFNSLTFTD